MLNLIKKLYLKLNATSSNEEKFYINVPYSEKDMAKELGAKWDPQKKSWFIPKELDRIHFEKWIRENNDDYIDSNIRSNGFFIAESLRSCWRCERVTSVLAFLLPENHQIKDYDDDDDKAIWVTADYKSMLSFISSLNKKCIETIQSISSYYYFDPSKSYYMNHCKSCNSKLGDFHMHSEPSGAFNPMTAEEAGNIKLHWCDELFEASVETYSIDVDHFEYMQVISSEKNN